MAGSAAVKVLHRDQGPATTSDRESIWTCAGSGAEVAIVAKGEIDTGDVSGLGRGLEDTTRGADLACDCTLRGRMPARAGH